MHGLTIIGFVGILQAGTLLLSESSAVLHGYGSR